MQRKNPSGFVDFTRGSELWTHQFKMFLTGISNVLILGVFITVSIVGLFLYTKIGDREIYAVKTQAEIVYKQAINVPNQMIEINLDGRRGMATIEQAEKIIAPYANRFWWAVKKALILGLLFSTAIIGGLVWYWYNYGRNVMRDEQLRGAKIVPKERLIELIKARDDASPYQIAGVPIRKGTEGNNICYVGAPQSGKSQAIRAFLEQIRARGKKAVVYDPSGEFTQEFYREGKDIILNPFDERCPQWSVWNEVEEDHHIDSIANGLIPSPTHGDSFFFDAARRSVADIIRVLGRNKNLQSNRNLFETVSLTTLKELQELLAGTSGATYFDPKTEKTGINIKMTILNYLDPFKFLRDEGEKFSLRDWVKKDDDSWVFITTKEEQTKAIKPIISLWITVVIKATMSLPAIHKERMWLVIDELPTLQKMDDLIISLTNTRKYGLCHIIGLQDFSQLDQTYGKDNSSTMISTLQTKLILRVTDSISAERCSKIIGQMEVDEKNMSRSMGISAGRDGDSFYTQRKERNVVMPSEIMSLPNMTGYLKIVGDYPVAKVKNTYKPHANNAIPFIPRETPNPRLPSGDEEIVAKPNVDQIQPNEVEIVEAMEVKEQVVDADIEQKEEVTLNNKTEMVVEEKEDQLPGNNNKNQDPQIRENEVKNNDMADIAFSLSSLHSASEGGAEK